MSTVLAKGRSARTGLATMAILRSSVNDKAFNLSCYTDLLRAPIQRQTKHFSVLDGTSNCLSM